MVTRYVLVGVTLLFAVFIFVSRTPTTTTTVTGHVVYSLSYAFTPALFGLLLAAIPYGVRRLRGKPQSFSVDWHWIWSVLLVIGIASSIWAFV